MVKTRRVRRRKGRGAPRVEISWGELVDRYTIIELKLRKANGTSRAAPLEAEHSNLQREMDWFLKSIPGAQVFYRKLNLVNSQLWKLEDRIRTLNRAGDTGDIFIRTAQSIALKNDKRSALKAAINKVAATGFEEVKIYRLE